MNEGAPREAAESAAVALVSTAEDRETARRLAAALRGYRRSARVWPAGPRRLTAELTPLGAALDLELSTEARRVLRQASQLVVICGAAAEHDRWIDEAVRSFRAHWPADGAMRLHLVAATDQTSDHAPRPAAAEGAADVIALGAPNGRRGVDMVLAALVGAPADDFAAKRAADRRRRRRLAWGAALALLGAAGAAVYGAVGPG